jgi:pyrimidine operon attenuation protein/uracil phosphoribosyltransferase
MSAPRPREKAQVLDETALDRALTRIAHEILERNGGAKDLAFVGLRTRGVSLAHRLAAKIAQIDGTILPSARSTSPCIETTSACAARR